MQLELYLLLSLRSLSLRRLSRRELLSSRRRCLSRSGKYENWSGWAYLMLWLYLQATQMTSALACLQSNQNTSENSVCIAYVCIVAEVALNLCMRLLGPKLPEMYVATASWEKL